MMSVVQTLRGPIDSGKLGRVLVHEHVFTMHMEYTHNYRSDFVVEDRVAQAASELNDLKQHGIDTIIDLTVLGIGRSIPLLLQVAERTDINIVVSTGCYTFNEVPGPLQYVGPGLLLDVPEPMLELFVKDITEGISGTSVKAGELKCAIDAPGLMPGVERVMRAIGQTNVQTGTPITVHTSPATQSGLVVQKVLAEEGVDLQDVIIGHSGDTNDLDYLMRLADRGSMLGMDRFGLRGLLTTQERVDTIVAMIKRGYLDRLVLSHDCVCWMDTFPAGEPRKSILPDQSYTFISRKVLPALLESGVTQDQIDTMFIDNPRRHFEGAAERFKARGG